MKSKKGQRARQVLALAGVVAAVVPVLWSVPSFAAAGPVPEEALRDLRWRALGPLRAGWSTCAEGVPDEPATFYFGAADGGVWKTTDAGITWTPIADRAPFSSVGALAIDSRGGKRTIYVGSGQVETRYDIMDGTGFWKSEDDGATWTSLGLADSEHIGRILLDPRDPNVIVVAALGHLFGPSSERGVYRTADGGKTWTKALFVDESTGAVDLASDPASPDVVYAATWQVRQFPWQSYFTPSAGPGSGIWKSSDGGKSWARVGGRGLPAVAMARIGLAVAPATGGARVYAIVDAAKDKGLYRTNDGGATWSLANADSGLGANNYFARLTVDPRNPDVVYTTGQSIHRSADGGKSFTIVKGAPGGDDYHFLWIDAKNPAHEILASDQGTAVSLNGGRSWSPWYNQATGQFYHLGVDDRFPYWVYGGQQDSGTAAVASRSDYGQLTFRDWHPVGAEERDYDLPDPDDPNIVYGSGLGGRLSKWDARTGRVSNVSPWPISTYAQRPTTVKYRYTWITPIAISPKPPHALYQGAQVLFRSLDKGASWKIVSPDLSGPDPAAKNCDGDLTIDRTTACGYGVIFAIAPSPVEEATIWIGTDNGRIQLTRDGGTTWTNVTPRAISDWSKIAALDASPTDAATAYAAVDRHRLDDRHPYAYRTHDFGKTWTPIVAGLPADGWVNVVRQDPRRAGLLFAGTRTGVFVSFDDGDHWQSLQANLPRTGVNDLLVHGDDLVVATQGRAIQVLDDISPLRVLDGAAVAAGAVFAPPATAIRLAKNENRDTPLPPEMPTTPNPPTGAIFDYWIPRAIAGAVTLEISDASGAVVRRFSSDDEPERPDAERYFAEEWLRPLPVLPARAGHNRFVWDLRLAQPKAADYDFSIAAVPGDDTATVPQGIFVLPGKYEARLTVSGKRTAQPLVVDMDPRAQASRGDLEAEMGLYRDATALLAMATDALTQVKALDAKLAATENDTTKAHSAKEVDAAKASRKELAPLVARRGDASLAAAAAALSSLVADLESADGPPSQPQRDVVALYRQRLDAALAAWKRVLPAGTSK